ncbi:recombinase family protein [Bacillus paranthracis]|uniref:recombinase family protein n=1 Tax=Bacillus paranthracis TaxID=2026186 RepID=UPI002151F008|nr:recombinase family protein [Bacillus paranthracis]MCR6465307.1 recombinase family protein [Bacillus paranthracis]MCR9022591.1 recombinase family protein [Bacillus paranthracis]
MRKIAYIRVSSEGQNTARQKKALKEAGCIIFYEEKVSGATMERPQLKQLVEDLQEGDTVFVHEISRLSRSTKDLLEIIEQIKNKGAGLKSINETWLDTSSDNPMNEFLLTIFSGLVQFERGMIKQRQKEGIAIAKAEGKFKGRKAELVEGGKEERRLQEIVKAYKEGKSIRHIREVYKVGTGTLYKILEREGLK